MSIEKQTFEIIKPDDYIIHVSLLDFELRRLKFIEACAYYVRITDINVNQLVMTQDLADLITERFRTANLEWAIGPAKFYTRLLEEGLHEKCNFIT